MSWNINVSTQVSKYLKKIDKGIQQQIVKGIDRLRQLEDPRKSGKALQGGYAGFWRYRFGDYRVICEIQDETVTILVIKVGHRKEVYE